MYSVHHTQYHNLHRRSERGFVLIAALMAVMILIAVGFFILTTTTQDIRISSRLVGERKALSAAESGLQQFCINFTPSSMAAKPFQDVDAVNDPTTRFKIGMTTWNHEVPSVPAYGFGEKMEYSVFNNTITGQDTSYHSEVQLGVGVKYGPVPLGTEYE